MKLLFVLLFGAILLISILSIPEKASVEESVIPCGGAPANWYPPFDEAPPGGRRYAWQRNGVIAVYIDPAFSDIQENGVREAFTTFQSASTTNSSGVSFSYIVGSPPTGTTSNYCHVKMEIPASGDDGSGRGQASM